MRDRRSQQRERAVQMSRQVIEQFISDRGCVRAHTHVRTHASLGLGFGSVLWKEWQILWPLNKCVGIYQWFLATDACV